MKEKDDNTNLPNRQAYNEEKNNLQGYTWLKLPVTSIFPAQKWMLDKKMLELKMKKITITV